jgi:ATP-dependent DNA helicase DinG
MLIKKLQDHIMIIVNNNKYFYLVKNINLPNIHKINFLVFDIEATGLDTSKEYPIQIGCVPLVKGKILFKNSFSSLIKSPIKIRRSIEKLTRISNKDLKDAPAFEDVIKKLWKKYNKFVWIAQCGLEFDFPLIERITLKNKIKKMDTKILFTYLNNDKKTIYSTDYLIDFYHINKKKFKRHDALNDAKLVAIILSKILKDLKNKKINDINIQKMLIYKYIPKKIL